MAKIKQVLFGFFLSVLAGGMLTSCSSDNDDVKEKLDPAVTVTITDGEITSEKATVTVTPSVQTGNWYCTIYPADDAKGKTDEQIVTELTAESQLTVKPQQGTQNVTWSYLAPATSYTVVAFGWNGKEASTVVRHNLTTEEEKPEQVASNYFDVDYWGDVYHKGYDNFIIYFGDAPHNSVNIKGLGTLYTLSIYNKTAADKSNPMPQEGEYTMTTADEPSDFCIEPSESRRFIVREFNEDNTYRLEDAQLQDAKATIKKNADGTWTLDAVIVDPNGNKKEFTYTGKVNLKDRSFKGYTGPVITDDVEYTADYTYGYNYAGTQFEIMDGGDPNADDASWFNRHRLTIRLAAEEDADGNKVPPVGTFHVSNMEAPEYVLRGDYVDLGGGAEGPDGTYMFYWNKKDFQQYYAFVQKGTVTITQDKDNAKVYTIKCDFTTEQGKKIVASYTGTLPTTTSTASAKSHKMIPGRLPIK